MNTMNKNVAMREKAGCFNSRLKLGLGETWKVWLAIEPPKLKFCELKFSSSL